MYFSCRCANVLCVCVHVCVCVYMRHIISNLNDNDIYGNVDDGVDDYHDVDNDDDDVDDGLL